MLEFCTFSIAMLIAAAAPQASRTTQFDGVTYTRQYVTAAAAGSLAEYCRPGETVENWTTLIAVRDFPHLGDPSSAAAEVIKALQKSNPQARFQFLVKEDKSEAMIDFITWPADASFAEFNLFRYLRRPGGPGLISYQFAYRFTDTSPDFTERFKQDRTRWVREMTSAVLPIDFAP